MALNDWLLVLTNVGIGSVIGGVTNELAIRMLFRPYKPWMIGSFRVPFTPGLIPRRHHELGFQMGKVVEEYLVTKEGIQEAIARGHLEETLRNWLTQMADKWLASDEKLIDIINRFIPEMITEEYRLGERYQKPLREKWLEHADRLIKGWEDKKVREILPPSLQTKMDDTIESLGVLLLTRFREYLQSPEGLHNVQNMIRGALGGGGGMLGGFVGMFLGDEKLISKLLPHLLEALENPDLARNLSRMIRQEADKLLDKETGEVLDWIGREQVASFSGKLFDQVETIAIRWLDKPLTESLGPFRGKVIDQLIPWISTWVLAKLETSIEHLFPKLSIAEIVAKQVDKFPLSRVEEMIIGISGSEFRMITILGFILGGIIGLVQGVLNLVAG